MPNFRFATFANSYCLAFVALLALNASSVGVARAASGATTLPADACPDPTQVAVASFTVVCLASEVQPYPFATVTRAECSPVGKLVCTYENAFCVMAPNPKPLDGGVPCPIGSSFGPKFNCSDEGTAGADLIGHVEPVDGSYDTPVPCSSDSSNEGLKAECEARRDTIFDERCRVALNTYNLAQENPAARRPAYCCQSTKLPKPPIEFIEDSPAP